MTSDGDEELRAALSDVRQRLGPDGSRNPARVRAALSDRLGASYPQHRVAVDALLAAMEAEPTEPPSPTLPAHPTPTPPTPTPPVPTSPADSTSERPASVGGDVGQAPPTMLIGGAPGGPASGAPPTRSGRGRTVWLGLALLLLVAAGVTAAVLLRGDDGDGGGGGGGGDGVAADAPDTEPEAEPGGTAAPADRVLARGSGASGRFWGFAEPFGELLEGYCATDVTEGATLELPITASGSLGCTLADDGTVDVFEVDVPPGLVGMAPTWGSPDASVVDVGRWSRDGADAGDYLVIAEEADRVCGYMSYDGQPLVLRNCTGGVNGWYPYAVFAGDLGDGTAESVELTRVEVAIVDHDRLEELQQYGASIAGTRCENREMQPGAAWIMFVAAVRCDLPEYRTSGPYYPTVWVYGTALRMNADRVNMNLTPESEGVVGSGDWSSPDGSTGTYRDRVPDDDGFRCRQSYRYGDFRWVSVCASNQSEVESLWLQVR